jgi:DNA invertase Pin-like site-specific DNA recombinase
MQGKDISEKLAKAEKQANVQSYPMQGRKPQALDRVQIDKALRMYSDGISLAKIASHFGVSYKTIYRIVVALKDCNTN